MRHDASVTTSGRTQLGGEHTGWTRLAGTVVLVLMALQGCASIVSGQSQVVSVETPGCDGARCELRNDKGTWFVPVTPGTVTVMRSYNNLQVTCGRGSVQAAPQSVASKTKSMAFGNILFGGIIGAGVDVSTGAAYDYPQLISVPMDCSTDPSSGAPPSAAPRLGATVVGDAAGLRVQAVDAGSPAARAGLLPGDLIVRADGAAVTRPDELARQLAAWRAPASLVLVVQRAGVEATLDVTPDLPTPTPDLPARTAP